MTVACCSASPALDAPDIATRLLRDLPVADLTIEDPPIEDVIEHVFASAKPADDAGATEAPAPAR